MKVKYLNSDENQISDIGKSISASIVFGRTESLKTKFNILGNSYQEVTDTSPSPDNPSEIISLGSIVTDGNLNAKKVQIE